MSETTKEKAAPAKTAAAAPAKPKAKRRNLTPAERIAKAEQDLKDLRAKASEGDRKQLAKVEDKLTKATAKRDEFTSQVNALTQERDTIKARLDQVDAENSAS